MLKAQEGLEDTAGYKRPKKDWKIQLAIKAQEGQEDTAGYKRPKKDWKIQHGYKRHKWLMMEGEIKRRRGK